MQQTSHVVINITGDSGDGIQLIGGEFSINTALKGNELSTFPNFPAEIRAPQGTLHGVSGFQIHFSSEHVFTAGDQCDVLVAMNAAALKSQLHTLKKGGIIIANTSGFSTNNLRLAKYETNPLEGDLLSKWKVIQIDISKLTKEALKECKISTKEKERAKNMFTLGVLYWMYCRDIQSSIDYISKKFAHKEEIKVSNIKALKAGFYFAETYELFQTLRVDIAKSKLSPGRYRSITGNHSLSIGLVTASKLADLNLYYATYPITPASDILHELSSKQQYGVITFQAEDEIAAVTASIGASYGGSLGVTGTSGPGLSLKAEAIGLAVMLETPLLICNIQRGGPSTGLPTKTEQSDLLQAFYGRHGECPLVILAPKSPADCFYMAIEAARLAVEYMTPVIILSDANIANGTEVWKFPAFEELNKIKPPLKTTLGTNETLLPYKRDEKGVRPWILPGTPHLTHRIGGLEKEAETGNISYEPLNHEKMVLARADKIAQIAQHIPKQIINTGTSKGKVLIVGWGSTYGVIASSMSKLHQNKQEVGHVHINYINPFPENLKDIFAQFETIVVAEMNNQQLYKILRATFEANFQPLNKIQGIPFNEKEITDCVQQFLDN